MSKNLGMCQLLDLYGGLLTEKQRDIMDMYYNDDFSLGEIADHYDISRQGVHDAIKRGDEALEEYESKLGLLGADLNTKSLPLMHSTSAMLIVHSGRSLKK